MKFARISENEITSAILEGFVENMREILNSDVIVVGSGPSGLVASMFLSRQGFRVVLIESNNYLGGGFWIGGYLMNTVTIRHPGNAILDAIGVSYREKKKGLFTVSGPYVCSKLIAHTMESGVIPLNMTKLNDVVLKNSQVGGVVVNWTPVDALPRQITCVDPIALESKMVIDATGHEAVVAKVLAKRGLIKVAGHGAMCVDQSEDLVVEKTSQVFPGLIVTGMAVAEVFGLPRMGPTFGGMLLSGQKAAEIAIRHLYPLIQPTEEKLELAEY